MGANSGEPLGRSPSWGWQWGWRRSRLAESRSAPESEGRGVSTSCLRRKSRQRAGGEGGRITEGQEEAPQLHKKFFHCSSTSSSYLPHNPPKPRGGAPDSVQGKPQDSHLRALGTAPGTLPCPTSRRLESPGVSRVSPSQQHLQAQLSSGPRGMLVPKPLGQAVPPVPAEWSPHPVECRHLILWGAHGSFHRVGQGLSDRDLESVVFWVLFWLSRKHARSRP